MSYKHWLHAKVAETNPNWFACFIYDSSAYKWTDCNTGSHAPRTRNGTRYVQLFELLSTCQIRRGKPNRTASLPTRLSKILM